MDFINNPWKIVELYVEGELEMTEELGLLLIRDNPELIKYITYFQKNENMVYEAAKAWYLYLEHAHPDVLDNEAFMRRLMVDIGSEVKIFASERLKKCI